MGGIFRLAEISFFQFQIVLMGCLTYPRCLLVLLEDQTVVRFALRCRLRAFLNVALFRKVDRLVVGEGEELKLDFAVLRGWRVKVVGGLF